MPVDYKKKRLATFHQRPFVLVLTENEIESGKKLARLDCDHFSECKCFVVRRWEVLDTHHDDDLFKGDSYRLICVEFADGEEMLAVLKREHA